MLKRIFAALLLGAAFILPAQATSVLPLYLEEIIDQASVAFQGTVSDVRSERDEKGRVVTYTTFVVRDTLKGTVGPTHTIKQIGGLAAEGLNFKVEGVPKFTVGENVVVFLYGASSEGFSSPVGLAQGRFAIAQDDAGENVSNGRDFRDMAKNLVNPGTLDAQAKSSGGPVRKMRIEQFKQIVRARAQAHEMAAGGAQ